MLIASLNEADLVHCGNAFGAEPGNHQRGTGAKIQRIYGSPGESLHTVDDGDIALHLNGAAHACQLVHILEAVLKNGLGDDGGASGQCQRHADLGLHIGGEARIGQGLHIRGMLHRAADDPHRLIIFNDGIAHFQELRGDGLQMLGDDILNEHISPGGGRGTHEGAGLDLVRNHRIAGAVESLHAPDADGVGAGALDAGAHAVQEVGHIHDMRLLGHILDDGLSLCQSRRQHDVDGGTHRNHVQVDVGGAETVLCIGHDTAVPDLHIGAQGPEALQMLVNGPGADGTAAGQRHTGLLVLAEQRSDKVVGCPDPPDKLVVDGHVGNLRRRNGYGMPVDALHSSADFLQGLQHDIHVPHIRQVLEDHLLVCQQCAGNDAQCRIFRTADDYLTPERSSALHDKLLFHFTSSRPFPPKQRVSSIVVVGNPAAGQRLPFNFH